MKAINKKSKITIYWKIWRGVNKVTENFGSTSTNLKVFLMGHDDVLVLNPSVDTEVDPGYEVLKMTISEGKLGVGAYGIKAVWTKNDGRDLLTSMRSGVFGITDSDAEASATDEEIRLVSSVESYGRDGMSAFETAVMRNLNNGISSEVEWVGNEATRIADEEARDIAEKAREDAEEAREAKRVDTFNDNEETRQTTFETNETNRSATFTSNETNRENAYLSSEQDREVRFATAEENRNKGEAIRQAAFEGGENVRATTFTRNEESRQRRFEDEVEQRSEAFNAYESSRQRAFEQAEKDRGVLFRSKEEAREAGELKREQAETIRNAQESVRQQAEQIRIDTFDENERERIATFNANEAARIAAENERKQNEAQREANEAIRQESYLDKLPVSAVVQKTGDGENVVMSQKAVSGKLAELESDMYGYIFTSIPFPNVGALEKSGAAFYSASNFNYTDYIKVKEGDRFYIECLTGSSETFATICGYTDIEELSFVSVLVPAFDSETKKAAFEIPAGISYIRASGLNDTDARFKKRVFGLLTTDSIKESINDINQTTENIYAKILDVESEVESCNVDFISGGYYTITNSFEGNTSFSYTDYIRVAKGDVIKYRGYAGNSTVSAISAYDNNGQFVSSLLVGELNVQKKEDIVIPEGVEYIRISIANNTHPLFIIAKATLVISANEVCRSSELQSLKDLTIFKENIVLTEQGYISSTNGYIKNLATFSTSPFIKVSEGDIISYYGYAGNPEYVAAIAGYDDRQNEGFVEVLLATNLGIVDAEVTIPKGISYIRVSAANSSHDNYVESDVYLRTSIFNYVGNKLQNSSNGNVLKGKKIAVIGDSISTINGNNTPYWEVKTIDVGKEIQSYVTWGDVYHNTSSDNPTNKKIGGVLLAENMVGTLQTFIPSAEDVGKQIGVPLNYNAATTKIWIEVLCEKTGATLLANASWSGSRITTHGDSKPYAISEAWSDYTIHRCQKRNDDGSYETPDIIIVYRGTNDLSHTPYSRIDEVDLSNGFDAETDLVDGNYQFRIGYYKTIQKLRNKYPKAIIYCATLNVFKRIIYDKFPTRNGIYTLPQMNDVIRDIANTMGCGVVEFDKDGITFENCYAEGYITDSATIPTHPNSKGHEVMARKAISDITHTL